MNTQKIIDALGGTTKTAELCEVSAGAVSQWIHSGIPPARLMFLKLARPDVFEHSDLIAPNLVQVPLSRTAMRSVDENKRDTHIPVQRIVGKASKLDR